MRCSCVVFNLTNLAKIYHNITHFWNDVVYLSSLLMDYRPICNKQHSGILDGWHKQLNEERMAISYEIV